MEGTYDNTLQRVLSYNNPENITKNRDGIYCETIKSMSIDEIEAQLEVLKDELAEVIRHSEG